jgi:hypothetical protein
MFWRGLAGEAAQRQTLSVLQANFRNTRSVTELANTLLKIKQARFGSIDRESNFLVQSTSQTEGSVCLLPAKDTVLRELDMRTRASVHHAVVVLRDEDKAAARAYLHTPLVFSVHEAKGLEYPHVKLKLTPIRGHFPTERKSPKCPNQNLPTRKPFATKWSNWYAADANPVNCPRNLAATSQAS